MLSTELIPSTNPSIWICNVEVIPHISIQVRRWLKGCIPAVLGHQKRIGTNCDTRSFSNSDVLQHPNSAFPDRCFFLNNDQFAVLHNILNVVSVFGIHCSETSEKITWSSCTYKCVNFNDVSIKIVQKLYSSFYTMLAL